MHAHQQRFTSAVEDLCMQFEGLVHEARARLGGLFRNEDYPATDELRGKFSFETKVRPLPDAGDFRVTLGDEEKLRIKRQITFDIEASLQVGTRELWHRLYEAVQHMADRLSAYKVTEDGVEHPFRDTVVTNLVKLVDVLPKLNITKDPELERLSEQVRTSLLVDPKELRQSDSARIETATKAAEIASRMAGYMAACAVPVFDRSGVGEPMEVA
jgi:hypothetical protein